MNADFPAGVAGTEDAPVMVQGHSLEMNPRTPVGGGNAGVTGVNGHVLNTAVALPEGSVTGPGGDCLNSYSGGTV